MQLFLQELLAFTPTASGAVMTAMSVAIPIGAGLGTFFVSKRQRYQSLLIAGMALMAASILLLTLMTKQSNLLLIILSLILVGLGTGTFFAVQMVVAQNALPQTQLGTGTGVIRYLGQLGPTLGAAAIGIVVNSALAGNSGGMPTTEAARIALGNALTQGSLILLGLSIVALITTFFLKDAPARGQERRE